MKPKEGGNIRKELHLIHNKNSIDIPRITRGVDRFYKSRLEFELSFDGFDMTSGFFRAIESTLGLTS